MTAFYGIILFPFAVWMLLVVLGIALYVFHEKTIAAYGIVTLILVVLFPGLFFLIGAALVIFAVVELLKWKSGIR
jgi:hypothetical protein